jgi:hypothetical protein
MGMAKHIVLTKPINLKVGIIGEFETIIKDYLFYFHFLRHLLVDQLFNFPFTSLKGVCLLKFVL